MTEKAFLTTSEDFLKLATEHLLEGKPVKAYCIVMQMRTAIANQLERIHKADETR